MQQAGFPALPQGGMAQPQYQPAPQPPAKDDAEERRLQEEKDRLEKKINDMEKLLSQEKEKALLATLKNQQDEALSSRVESSLKDIQDKMRRDRRDHEVEEERLTLKSKIKELETRLAQERETWMTTLKNQMSEREVQGRDVEGHFVYRLQEMERRWLDEKAQWQKEISSREELIRSLKSSAEKLRDVEDEYRKISLEKSMAEREISKLRDDLARSDREKASVETYLKMMPEKEREISDVRSENAMLRSREETFRMEAKHRDEKNVAEIGRLQAEIGTLSDRKNAELNEALRKAAEGYEAQLQEKDKTIADVSGEKVRAISELMKIKGFVSRVQAINAVLEKERGQLKLEKMQLAQNMASQMEELRRLKSESEGLRGAHQAELEAQAARFASELEKVRAEAEKGRAEASAELTRRYEEKISELNRARQEELLRLSAEKQAELAKAAADHQAEMARIAAERQGEVSRISAERQAEFDAKVSQLRLKYEASSEEEKAAVRRQLEESYTVRLQEAKASASAALDAAARLEAENRRLVGETAVFEKTLADRAREFADRQAAADAELKRREERAALLEKTAAAGEAERQRIAAEVAGLRESFSALEAQKAALQAEAARLAENFKAQAENLRLETENRSRFESELLFLKQKIQQMELQAAEYASQLEAAAAQQAAEQAAAARQAAADSARIAELSAEVGQYKAMEASLGDRLKWALKGKKQ